MRSWATPLSICGAGSAIGIRPCAPRPPAEGVGFARKPPLWMKPGDVVEVEIDGGLGVLRNPIIAES